MFGSSDNGNMMGESATILLVEDNEDDALLAQQAAKHAKISSSIRTVSSGQQAVQYLSGAGTYADRKQHPLPYLMLLDLKMPSMNGFDVLTWIKNQPDLKNLVVIVFSSSNQNKDVNQSYELGARSYLIKPSNFQDLISMMRSVESFWITNPSVQLPDITKSQDRLAS